MIYIKIIDIFQVFNSYFQLIIKERGFDTTNEILMLGSKKKDYFKSIFRVYYLG